MVDHGKIYVGEHQTSACRQLGISIQPARLREGHDKGPIERFFRTIRDGFLQELPAYKGPDVYSRGVAPEQDAFFFIDELEALLREWVAAVYHLRPHNGIGEPGLWALGMSPAQMFEHGIARAGYIEAPRDPSLAYQFLRSNGAPSSTTESKLITAITAVPDLQDIELARRVRTRNARGGGPSMSIPTMCARCISSTGRPTHLDGTPCDGPKQTHAMAR